MAKISVRDLDIIRGDDTVFTLTHTASGVPVDLTGYTIVVNSSSEFLTQDAVITDAVNGEYSINFTSDKTSLLTRSRESYKMEYYPSGLTGTKQTKFEGTISVELG